MAGDDGGRKRGGRPWKGGQGDGKRHKGALAAAANAKGSGGVLVTCDKTKERQSVRDALNLLNEAADKYFPSQEQQDKEHKDKEDDKNEEQGSKSVQEMLAAEVAALKADAKQRRTGRFTALDTGVKGAVLIQCLDEGVSPVALVGEVLGEVERTKEFASRFISRMIPLERVGYSGVDEIREVARPLIEQHLDAYKQRFAGESEVPPLEYAVEIKRRNCTGLKTMDVINALVELVGPEHKVNLTTPASVILVEVFRNTCGVSVLSDFHRFKKYNVRSIIDPPVSTKPEDKPKDGEAEKDNEEKETKKDNEEKDNEKDNEEETEKETNKEEQGDADEKEDKEEA